MYANGANISFAAPKNYDPETMINTEQATNCFNTVEFGHTTRRLAVLREISSATPVINMVKMGNANRKSHLTRKGEQTRRRRNPKEKAKPSGSRMLMTIIYSG